MTHPHAGRLFEPVLDAQGVVTHYVEVDRYRFLAIIPVGEVEDPEWPKLRYPVELPTGGA